MLCPNCGADCGDAIRLCPKCEAKREEEAAALAAENLARQGPPQERSTAFPDHIPENTHELDYAGFWLRVCSASIDGFVLCLIAQLVVFIFGLFGIGVIEVLVRLIPQGGMSQNFVIGAVVGMIAALFGMLLLIYILGLIYFAGFESSSWQATPGKRFAGTILTDLDGSRISFWRAIGRNLGKIISGLLFSIGFLLPLFNERKQTLHDIIAGCVVRKREERPFPLLLGATIVAIILIFSVRQLTAPRRTGYRSITPMHIDISNPDSYTGGIHTPGKPAAPAAVPWPTTRPEPEMLPPPTPTPEPEETPEHFNGPHARIRSHSSMFDAQSVVAFYYPKNNSVALGFFPMQLSASELEVLKKRGVLGNAGGHQRPLMTMYLDFQQGTGDASVKSLRDYTINFYQDAMLGFTFDSVNDAVSFSKTAEQILAEDKIELSGVLRPGGTIHFAIRGKGAPRSNQKLRFRWDIDHEAVLLGTN